jgi:hypothetical protein
MCHGPTSRPPMPPVSGGAGGGRRVVLEASDGNRFAAFSATTEILDAPGVVILPDVRGLHPFYEELALRFGDAGVHALALDYYGRTAGTGSRGGDFDHQPHLQQATDANVGLVVAAAVAYLRSSEGGGVTIVSRWSSGLVAGSRSIRRRAHRTWPASSASTAGWRKPSLGTPPPRWSRHRGTGARCWACSEAPTPRSRPSTLRPFGRCLTPAGSATNSSSTRAPRIRSSTARSPITRERPRMPGAGCLPSSTGIQAMGSSPGRGAFRRRTAV